MRAVELAAAVVGNDDGVGAGFGRHAGVFGIKNALDDELAAPELLDPFHILP
ncbi:hypothetical protein D3C87_2200120 [compost metagenome]